MCNLVLSLQDKVTSVTFSKTAVYKYDSKGVYNFKSEIISRAYM